ncbi:MAG: TrkH family potassium uptake protein [Desulfobulbaceae bacterium]|uniref:TrkH family potassium uptake protein n=1 Tax=Candidatus Desulfobia pelagia TaxID=2841692 RepID=A0A8J6NG01_9BACT|nr:TrkH family potassium uptake protein [Candidatus Desulfobia pelagia]
MHLSSIAHVIGILLIVTGSSMILPIACSLYYNESDLLPLLYSSLLILTLGFSSWWFNRRSFELDVKDGIFVAVFGWILVSSLSGLPYMLHGSIPSFTDAFFEMMSGYTTTGATILTDIEVVPHGLLFWRSETHLLGGMGFLTLTIIFLPKGMGGLRIFRAESSPGQVLTGEKFKARNRDTMIWLWGIYLGLNVLNTLLLWLGGMSFFDSLCHAFGTVSTSGYSPKNASIGHYGSAYFDWVTIIFMFLGGVTFILFFQMMKGEWKSVKINTEFRWYISFLLFFCGIVSLILWKDNTYLTLMDSIRYGTFQVMSLLTTTGYSTADYELWPQSAQMFLYVVCFIGACAGSTTSGIKIVHYAVICKYMYATIRKIFFQPLSVISIRLNKRPVDSAVIDLSICYFIVNIFMILAGGCFLIMIEDIDYVTAMSSIISSLMNIGPGFGAIGPSENFAFFSDTGKWFLAWNMLVGRLEMFSALVIFYPSFWQRG